MRMGITGHRGLGGDVERWVRERVGVVVRGFDAAGLVGVSCIADGPDAWFAEAVLAHGGRLEVVIPAAGYRAALPEWHHATYDALLERASVCHRTGWRESTSEAHMAGSEILVGLSDMLLAVWDGEPARGFGGTADVVAYAERSGVPVRVLWPAGATR